MSAIHVNICLPDVNLDEHWAALAKRAAANVFMNPAALNAVYATKFARIHMLLAWDKGVDPEKLVGVWALQQMNITPLWSAFLRAPPYKYAFISCPVVDPAFMEDVILAFFNAIEIHPALPNVIHLKYLDGESEAYHALLGALAARGSQNLKLSEYARPFITKDFGLKRSGSTRKKLRQDWNRLSSLGSVDIVNERTRSEVRDAFEVFLAMEAESWKGSRGTALLSDEKDATFARRLIWNLAEQQNASVALLRVGDQPIAAQVLLYCGNTAYTWKTAFDSEYAKYSPGGLLVDRISDQLFSTTDIQAIESCAAESSFMAQLWEGRRPTIDLLVDMKAKKSLNFVLAAIGHRAYAQLRNLRNKLRSLRWSFRPRTRGLAPSS